jgi:gamma-glutamyltranspeptidase/glutathione hydrolase
VATEELAETLVDVRDRALGAVSALLPELADDIARYEVAERVPLARDVDAARVVTTPLPSIGGTIVLDIVSGLASDERGSLAGAAEVLSDAYGQGLRGRPTGTTHISVVDADGRAAALSSTLGSGSGVFRGGAQLNNMLGELDVVGAVERVPGERLPSMMAPTLVTSADEPRLVLGSAGSVRLAGAIGQVVASVLGGAGVEEAIAAPRIHVEGGTLHAEGGWPDAELDELAEHWEIVRWGALNLYFGGVQAVERTPDGELRAAGDPRRGGRGIVVA